MDTIEIKKFLAEYLPKYWMAKVIKALKEKDLSYSRSYISEVCNPANIRYNSDIGEIALKLAIEEKKKVEAQKELLVEMFS